MPFAYKVFLTLGGLSLGLSAGMASAETVAVVSARNPVAAMTKNQVMDIFLGRASRFPDGRLAMPIDQPEDSAAREEFYLVFDGKSAAQLKAHWSKVIFTGRGRPPREAPDGREVKKLILANPQAIGYIERNLVDDSLRVVLAP